MTDCNDLVTTGACGRRNIGLVRHKREEGSPPVSAGFQAEDELGTPFGEEDGEMIGRFTPRLGKLFFLDIAEQRKMLRFILQIICDLLVG